MPGRWWISAVAVLGGVPIVIGLAALVRASAVEAPAPESAAMQDAVEKAARRAEGVPPRGVTLTFDGPIDGSDRVVISATEAKWENVHWGTWREDVTLNGVVWNPRKNPVLKNDGAMRFLPPGVDLTKARVVERSGRDFAGIEIEGKKLVLRFVDSVNGIGHYRLVVAFE
jgi:hypothetical protein